MIPHKRSIGVRAAGSGRRRDRVILRVKLAKILERNGWNLLRVLGSHHIYGKTGSEIRLSVPVHKNQDCSFI